MFTRSHLQEMKRRYASMYAPPVEEKVIEDGTIEGVEQYKKDTPGQDIEKEFKEHCGVCGEEDEKESIEEKYVIKHRKNKNRYLSNKAMDASNVKDALKFKSEKEAKNTLNGLDWQFRSNYEIVKEEEENVLDEAKNIKTVKLIVSPKPDATKTHAILLKMFPQENRNDLWDLARNMEDVGATLKENLKLDEIVKTKDKSVIDSFYDEKPLEGKMLSTDGKTLDKIGIGAQQIAKWNNGKITVTAKMDSKSTESILKYLRNNVPEKMFTEEIELDEGTAYPPTIENLRMIVKDKQHQKFMFPKGQAIVDLFTASAMVQVYDALKKPDMKKTFEKMIADKAGFLKTQAFAMKMIGK